MTRVTPAMKRSRGLSGVPVGSARERLHNAGETSATIHTTYIAWPTVPPTFENRAAQRHRNRSYRRVVRCFGEAIRVHWAMRRRNRSTKVDNVGEALASDIPNARKQQQIVKSEIILKCPLAQRTRCSANPGSPGSHDISEGCPTGSSGNRSASAVTSSVMIRYFAIMA